jgi:predicted transcriptional regulator
VTESEYKLCLILWEHEPIKSAELVRLCEEKLGWKETTTYTVIKRLSDRGVVKNEKTIVSSLVPKSAIQAAQLDDLVERTFEGSLPAFIAAFTSRQRLSEKQIDEIQAMIDRCRRGEEP